MAQDRVEAVERALTVMETFDSRQDRFSLAELAVATGYYKSTLLRLLASLERFDYVERGADGRYRLGYKPVRLARRHMPSRALEAWAGPIIQRLASESGETAALIEVQGRHAECRLVSVPAVDLRHELRTGQQWQVKRGAPPCLTFDGGLMVCRRLDEEEPTRWLSLSGPAGRLDATTAQERLDRAVDELNARASDIT